MARRRRHKPIPASELPEQHSRCPWDGLKANDELIAKHWRQEEIGRQRRRCRHWVETEECSWQDLFGEP